MMGGFNPDENSGRGKKAMLGCSFACLDPRTMSLGILIPRCLAELPGHPSSRCLICACCWVCPLYIKKTPLFSRVYPKMAAFSFHGYVPEGPGVRLGVARLFDLLEISGSVSQGDDAAVQSLTFGAQGSAAPPAELSADPGAGRCSLPAVPGWREPPFPISGGRRDQSHVPGCAVWRLVPHLNNNLFKKQKTS